MTADIYKTYIHYQFISNTSEYKWGQMKICSTCQLRAISHHKVIEKSMLGYEMGGGGGS